MGYKLNGMNKIKFIKTAEDYTEALKLVETLMISDPDVNSDEGEQLALLSALIQDYESRSFPETLPNPIDAIKFRMDQAGLKPVDLIPYIGSRSRVSEILSGKRQLTLEMMRALEIGLGIPAKVLIKKPDMSENAGANSEYQIWDNRLVSEMESRGYFGHGSLKKYDKVNLLTSFFSSIGQPAQLVGMMRKSNYRSSPLTDKRALSAWSTRVIQKAKNIKISNNYKDGTVTLNFMREIAKLSVKEKGGVLLAQDYLKEYGITLVIEPHFPKTYLDGATILINKDNPIIGLTLRHNRLDNFWFTLMHELAHIVLHYNHDISLFYDEIEGVVSDINEMEKDADMLAQEALLPNTKWEVCPARIIPSSMAANSLAKELGVHVAIIAGQIRHRGNKYIYLNKIINNEKVRHYFPHEKWNK